MNIRRLLPGFAVLTALAVGVGVGTWLTKSAPEETSNAEDLASPMSETTQFKSSDSSPTSTPLSPLNSNPFLTNDLSLEAKTETSTTGDFADSADPGSNDSIARQISLADEWLSTGYFPRAKAGYHAVLSEVNGNAIDGLMFRIALCSELIGDCPQALSEYQTLSTRSTSSVWSSASRLGEARCLAATGRTELLRTEMLPMAILDETAFPVWIVGEMMHLAGRSIIPEFSDMASLQSRQRLLTDDGLAIPGMQVEPEELLALMDSRRTDTYSNDGPPLFRLLQRTGGTPDGCYLQLQQRNVAVRSLLDAILNECGFTADVSNAAETAIGQHGQTLYVTDRSLSLILDGICLRFGLVWQQNGTVIRFTSNDEAGIKSSELYSQTVGERVLRAAVMSAPDSSQSEASQLTLGAMLFNRQMYADAAHTFRVYLERRPHAELVGLAAFNLAKSSIKLRQPQEARQYFLRCIDDNKTTRDLRICAYVNLGQLQLGAGDTKAAISMLVRGLSQSRGHWSEVDTALMLASAYLLADNPQAANSILMERRSSIQQKPHVDAAAFISAYCGFRRAAAPNRVAREAETLVTALSHVRPSLLHGNHWFVLLGSAYEDIGLTADATKAYTDCLDNNPSEFLLAHCSLRLAQILLEDNGVAKADEILKAVPDLQNETLQHQVMLKRAEIAQEQGNLQKAMTISEALAMSSSNNSIKKAALRILGSSYEQQGNPRAAVYCYAGMVPTTEDHPMIETINHEATVPAAEGSPE